MGKPRGWDKLQRCKKIHRLSPWRNFKGRSE